MDKGSIPFISIRLRQAKLSSASWQATNFYFINKTILLFKKPNVLRNLKPLAEDDEGHKNMSYFVYILECNDKSFYVGITENMQQRFAEHNSGKGPKFTAKRLPVKLVYNEECKNLADARKREIEIKGWRREKKENLIRSKQNLLKFNKEHRYLLDIKKLTIISKFIETIEKPAFIIDEYNEKSRTRKINGKIIRKLYPTSVKGVVYRYSFKANLANHEAYLEIKWTDKNKMRWEIEFEGNPHPIFSNMMEIEAWEILKD